MKKLDTFLKLTPNAAARINKRAEGIIATSTCMLPMIVKPRQWHRGMTDGGAYLSSFSPLSLFKTRNRKLLKEIREIEHPEFQHFIDGHNVMSRSGFIIDKETLKLLKMMTGVPRKFAKLPSFESLQVECPLTEEDAEKAAFIMSKKSDKQKTKDFLAAIEKKEPEHYAIVKAFAEWRLAKVRARKKAVEQAGTQSNFLRTLEIAEDLKDFHSIYFPSQSDDRGRAYYATPLLNPQGADHEKALLLFDVAKRVGKRGFDWMRINVSNLMGNDKANYKQRIAYVEANKEMIISCVKNPLKDFRWELTDKPFQFLQAARELVEAWEMKDPTKFKSRVGIACDASCSGLQILGTMTRCESSMRFTNCLPASVGADGEHYMQDIYGEAGRIAGEIMRKVAAGELEGRRFPAFKESKRKKPLKDPAKEAARLAKEAARLAEYEKEREIQAKADRKIALDLLNWSYAMKDEYSFTRNWLKRNTMTFFYGSGRTGMIRQISVDHILPEYDKALAIVGQDGNPQAVGFPWASMEDAKIAAHIAASVNYDAICAMADKPSQVMQSLQRYATLIAVSGRKMRWTTPLGLIVEQHYEVTEAFKVDSQITGKVRRQTTTHRLTGEVDVNGQRNGAAPNFVHSIDVSLLLKVLSLGSKLHNLWHWRVVHDSFAVHACDTDVMVNLLKNTMADMLDRGFLDRVAVELESQIDWGMVEEHNAELIKDGKEPLVIIPFPELGDESLIDQLRQAQYPFC